MPRDTRTGGVLEQMVLPSLTRGGYDYKVRVKIGQRMGCGSHYVDVIAEKDGAKYLISMKWQQVAGTAEQKIPFEVICLAEALEGGEYEKAYEAAAKTRDGQSWFLKGFFLKVLEKLFNASV